VGRRLLKLNTGQAANFWPVFLLIVVVMVPTISVLWFVSVAVQNEQLADRQRLADAYRTHLLHLRQSIDEHWRQAVLDLQLVAEKADGSIDDSAASAQRRFMAVVSTGTVQSVVCYDQDDRIEYPTVSHAPSLEFTDARWREAQRKEHQSQDTKAALTLYESIESDSTNKLLQAFAMQARVRCLLKLYQYDAALAIVANLENASSPIRDSNGRLMVANVELMVVEQAPTSALKTTILQRLGDRLDDHDERYLPASQRLFLMKRLNELFHDFINKQTLAAEELAVHFLAAQPAPVRSPALQPAQLPEVWQIATTDGRLLLLLNLETVIELSESFARDTQLPNNVRASVTPPGQPVPALELVSIQAGTHLPGWRLSLLAMDGYPESSVAGHRTLYVWIGVLVVLFTSTLATYIAFLYRRQIQVMNLKNNLIGTVSHELKTPLSSMRLLVDTLLEAEEFQPQQTREYLQLIARENARLSRLIENFLTFSRLDGGKQTFDFSHVAPAEIVARAVEAAGDRFRKDTCEFTIDIDEVLPPIDADEDCLVIAVLNLLDNAWKYSGEPRKIGVRVNTEAGDVYFSVRDNGTGLSPAESKRVFQKFYQSDHRLIRKSQGCGLGLSIVREIVEAHGGHVSVSTDQPVGSTFTIRIPQAGNAKGA